MGIRAEHLKGCLAAANKGKLAEEKGEEKTEAEEEGGDLWEKVVEITQTAFWEGEMAEEANGKPWYSSQKGRRSRGGLGWWRSLGRS